MKSSLKILVALPFIFVVTQAHAMRWYSPSTGSWFSRDPIGERGGLNLRAFVAGDPVNICRQIPKTKLRPLILLITRDSIAHQELSVH